MLPLVTRLTTFLDRLERVQAALVELFAEKRRSLVTARTSELAQLAAREAEAAKALQEVVADRSRLLSDARRSGYRTDSIGGLVPLMGALVPAEWVERLRRAEAVAAQLREESWVHWIISHRCYNHYTELLDLIAHGGETSPTYSRQPDRSAAGGVLLDASV